MKNSKLKSFAASALLLGSSGYLLNLYFSGKNSFYISPAYFEFNLAMSVILFLVAVASLRTEIGDLMGWRNIPIVVFLLLGVFLAPEALSSTTAGSRNLNVSSFDGSELGVSPLLNKDPKTLRVADWVRLKNYDPNPARIVGQQVDVVGFIFKTGQPQAVYSVDNFLVGRFVVTCCAVDAAPVGLEVESDPDGEDWLSRFEIDQWVRIQGVWALRERDGERYLVVEATEIANVDRPDDPYE